MSDLPPLHQSQSHPGFHSNSNQPQYPQAGQYPPQPAYPSFPQQSPLPPSGYGFQESPQQGPPHQQPLPSIGSQYKPAQPPVANYNYGSYGQTPIHGTIGQQYTTTDHTQQYTMNQQQQQPQQQQAYQQPQQQQTYQQSQQQHAYQQPQQQQAYQQQHTSPYSNPQQYQQPIHSTQPPTIHPPTTHPIHQTFPTTPAGGPIELVGQSPAALGLDGLFTSIPPLSIQPVIDPSYLRCTLTKIPKSSALLGKTKLPFGISITPYPRSISREEVPVIGGPIVRCRRCRTYLNPYIELVESGSRWRCNLCYLVNDFPANYDYDPTTNIQIPRSSRSELSVPVYEFMAPVEYMVRPPQPPVYLFLIDVTHASVKAGLVATAARTIKESLDSLPDKDGRTKVGFITFDQSLHFYQFPLSSIINDKVEDASATANQSTSSPLSNFPTMLVVPDLEESNNWIPSLDDNLLISLSEHRATIEQFLERLAGSLFINTHSVSSALGSALTASLRLLSSIGGKIVVIQASLPNIRDGALTDRDNIKLLGTVKESSLLQPLSHFYKSLATECSRLQVCIDLFLAPTQATSMDMASLSCAAKYTGGTVYYYPGFNASSGEDALRLAADLSRHLANEIGLESVVRIRASQGLSISSYFGNFFLRSSDLLALPNVNPDHSYTAQLSIDEPITSSVICFQTAVLHTNCYGERRIRVINAAFSTSDNLQDILNGADQGAIVDLLTKLAIEKALNYRLEDAREALINKLVDILGAIRQAFHSAHGGQLLCTGNLKLLPLLILAISKSIPIRSGAFTLPDQRVYLMNLLMTCSVNQTLLFLHPAMFLVNGLTEKDGILDNSTGKFVYPPLIGLSGEKLDRSGIFVLDNGLDVCIWIGSDCNPEALQLVFGTNQLSQIGGNRDRISLPLLTNPYSQRIHNIVENRRNKLVGGGRGQPMLAVSIIQENKAINEGAQHRAAFVGQLVEDRGLDGQPSYMQWINLLREKVNK